LGVSYGAFVSELRFDNNATASILQHATHASVELDVSDRWTVQLAAGALLGGRLWGEVGEYHFTPGASGTVGASYRVVGGERATPFFLLSASLSASVAGTQADSDGARAAWGAADFRVGALVGKTFFNALSPYLTVRAFGGPIFWQLPEGTRVGSDQHHFQVGLGAVFAPHPRLQLFVELIPLGERRVSGGLSYSL